MGKRKVERENLLVLVPHRDTRLVLQRFSDVLFKQGFEGAYSFPWAAPLACLSRPFDAEELKECARALKETTETPKFTAKEAGKVEFTLNKNKFALFGSALEMEISPAVFKNSQKITNFFSSVIIGACLLDANSENTALPCPPQVSFGAAALANMSWEPLEQGDGYKWKIGKLYWLPKINQAI